MTLPVFTEASINSIFFASKLLNPKVNLKEINWNQSQIALTLKKQFGIRLEKARVSTGLDSNSMSFTFEVSL
jgi:hypothetical protein